MLLWLVSEIMASYGENEGERDMLDGCGCFAFRSEDDKTSVRVPSLREFIFTTGSKFLCLSCQFAYFFEFSKSTFLLFRRILGKGFIRLALRDLGGDVKYSHWGRNRAENEAQDLKMEIEELREVEKESPAILTGKLL